MSEIDRIVANIRTAFADSVYPADFLDKYDQMECFASHNGRETFLVQRKSDGKEAIAKCYDRRIFPFTPNIERLQSFHEPGLPGFYEKFRNEKTVCIVREYIEGSPLNIYFEKNRPDLKEILGIADQLCIILHALHSQEPPLIHRDIKPENIIMKPDGSIVLIDFDISRSVRDDSGTDTISFGTRGYAAPEQYGFEQTDRKTDIYSFGILLRWMVTGNIRHNQNIRIDPSLQKIIDKCTAFSPEDRYDDIKKVQNDLKNVGKKRLFLSRKALLTAVFSALLICALGFSLGRFTDLFQKRSTQETRVVFTEPLIEKAVRLQLALSEAEPLTKEKLAEIRTLYIYGNEAYTDPQEYFRQDKAFHTRGPIHTLADLELLPNIEMFFMVFQGKVNISALGHLKHLTYVELKHMQLEDIYPLSDLRDLRGAVLFDTGLSDVTALESCHWLDTLDIGHNPISDMKHIGTHPYVKNLSLRSLNMKDLSGIEKFISLKGLTLCQARIEDLSSLKEISSLETVYITDEMENTIREQLSETKISIAIQDN